MTATQMQAVLMDPFVSPTHHPLVGLSDETQNPLSGE